MVRTFDAATTEDLATDNSDRIEKGGWYHLVVLIMKDQELPYSDTHYDGYSLQVKSLAGPEVDRVAGLTLLDPNASHRDGGAFMRKRQSALFVALNLAKPESLGKSIEIDEGLAAGAQFIAKLKLGDKNDNGDRFPEIEGLKVYHVDDPRVKDVEKNAEELRGIHESYRHDSTYFDPILPKKAEKPPVGNSKPDREEFNQEGL